MISPGYPVRLAAEVHSLSVIRISSVRLAPVWMNPRQAKTTEVVLGVSVCVCVCAREREHFKKKVGVYKDYMLFENTVVSKYG